MISSTPATRDLLLVGGGHAHALVLRMWGMKPLPGARLTLVAPEPVAAYTGMLPGHVAGHYRREEIEIDLVRLARFAGARLVLDRVRGLDPARGTARLERRGEIGFDVCSINVGVTSGLADLPGADAFAAPAKPLDAFADAWEAFLESVREGRAAPRAAVIGAGAGGVELSLAMMRRMRVEAPDPASCALSLIEAGPAVLPRAATALRDRLERALAAAGVEVRTHARPRRLTAEGVELDDGGRLASGFTALAAGATPPAWLGDCGLELRDGFVVVDAGLRSSAPNVFAAGDAAHLSHAPREKAGVFAVRAGPVLKRNLEAALTGRRLRRFRPQRDYLKLVSLGDQRAVAEKHGLALSGGWAWRWKDGIDRRFMARFDHLPAMDRPPRPPRRAASGVREAMEGAPLCGGCGSKAGPEVLQAGLSGLARGLAPAGERLRRAAGDDAAVLAPCGPDGAGLALTTDHLRAFTLDWGLFARVAALHAASDVLAMGGRPDAALATFVLPPLSPDLQARTLKEMRAAAEAALADCGAALAGGHTSLGAELIAGFTVTGAVEGAGLGLDGARPGDALILTRPLGSGVILAAEMRGLARGRDVAALLATLTRSPAGAAAALSARARAMTDVTGFGLAGHLLSLLDASGVAAEIDLAQVPLHPGAEALAKEGVRSSLYPETALAGARIEAPAGLRGSPAFELLFDPQTAGGLLAAVPADQADAAVAAARAAGEPAVAIGRVIPRRAPPIRLLQGAGA